MVFDEHQIAEGRAPDADKARLQAEAALTTYVGLSPEAQSVGDTRRSEQR